MSHRFTNADWTLVTVFGGIMGYILTHWILDWVKHYCARRALRQIVKRRERILRNSPWGWPKS